jgi:AraC-like DNA-binding protein
MLAGAMNSDYGRDPEHPELETRMLHLREGANLETGWLAHFIRAAIEESEKKRPGGESILSRLSELMFVEVVRRYLTSLPEEQTGWLAGLRDRNVGQALNLLHGQPAFAWTLGRLAEEVGLSRSAFIERFTHFVGVPPMHYLAQWRMQVATGLLISRIDSVARVRPRLATTLKQLSVAPSRSWSVLRRLPDARNKWPVAPPSGLSSRASNGLQMPPITSCRRL